MCKYVYRITHSIFGRRIKARDVILPDFVSESWIFFDRFFNKSFVSLSLVSYCSLALRLLLAFDSASFGCWLDLREDGDDLIPVSRLELLTDKS